MTYDTLTPIWLNIPIVTGDKLLHRARHFRIEQ